MRLRPLLDLLLRPLVVAAALLAVTSAMAQPAGDERLVVHTATGQHVFTVEVVDTPEATSRGLMFRESLAADAGMLFDFKTERPVSFWMKNTLIPLDMVFIANSGEVMSLYANAQPHDERNIPSAFPVRFVLEIPGGRARAIGLRPGDRVEHIRIE